MVLEDIVKTLNRIRYKLLSLKKIYILERPLTAIPNNGFNATIKKPSIDCVVQQLKASSGDLLEKYMAFKDEVNKEDVMELLADEHKGFLILNNKKIIGSTWLTTKYYPYSQFKKVSSLFKDTVHISKVFVSPQLRGKGIAPYLLSQVLQSIDTKAFKKATTLVYCWNKGSVKCFQKLQFNINYKLCIIKIGPLRFHYLTNYKDAITKTN